MTLNIKREKVYEACPYLSLYFTMTTVSFAKYKTAGLPNSDVKEYPL